MKNYMQIMKRYGMRGAVIFDPVEYGDASLSPLNPGNINENGLKMSYQFNTGSEKYEIPDELNHSTIPHS